MPDRPGPAPSLIELSAAIVRGDRDSAADATRAAIAADEPAEAILDAATGAMGIVGHRFACNDIYVPEMLISARAMKASMAILEPVLVEVGIDPLATAVIGTVKGDLHDIGKNLVATMWRSARLDVVDLGADVAPEGFAAAARDHGARIVGISALLTTTMAGMADVVTAVREAGPVDVRVVVGGAPVTAEFAATIGADATAPDAASAATLVPDLLGADRA